jgi:hypothetical protein
MSKDSMVTGSSNPSAIARATSDVGDVAGDAADQAERLTMIMEAEAARNGMNGGGGEGTSDLPYPLEDIESVLAMEDAEDGSDDPMHAGGLTPARWVPAEQAAMHVVDEDDPSDDRYLDDESDAERADPNRDQFDGPVGELTPEDETLLGIDPYDA